MVISLDLHGRNIDRIRQFLPSNFGEDKYSVTSSLEKNEFKHKARNREQKNSVTSWCILAKLETR